ncbi:MAG: hypothetical protein ABMA13_02265 [Chthoniobacteraceae bacterium]
MKFSLALVLLGLLVRAFCQTPAPIRTWTTTEGKTFQATLVSVQGTQVTVRLGNGQLAAIGLPRLSPGDQAFIKSVTSSTSATAPSATPASSAAPNDKRVWPQKVEVDTRAIEVTTVSEDVPNKKCMYRSRNFEFTAEDKLAPSVMKEVARTFESTRSLMEGLPWALQPEPVGSELFQAKFFATRESFIAAGGGEKTAATIKALDGLFLAPFSSFGLELRGKAWAKSGKYDDRILVLEVAKLMMGNSYRLLPDWIWHGASGYASFLPNNAGVVLAGSHERGLKEYIKHYAGRGYNPSDAGPVFDLLQMPSATWSERSQANDTDRVRMQVTAPLLVYYFCHLDDDGKGTRFLRYMDKIAEARRAGAAPGARGSFGLSQLEILLDGRDKDAMQKAVVDGYKKIGVRWQ